MTPRSVVIVGLNYSPEMTGIAPYTTGLANALVAAGYEVTVVAAHPHYPQWSYPPSTPGPGHTVENGVKVIRVKPRLPRVASGLGRLRFELEFGVRAGRRIPRGADAVVLVSPAMFGSWALLRRRKAFGGAPVGLVVQDLYALGAREAGAGGGLFGRAIHTAESQVLRAVDSVSVIHPRFQETLLGEFRLAADKVRVIRNWTHVAAGTDLDTDRGAARQEMGWASDETIVLHTGAMGAKQALENVVDAAALADRSKATVRFVLVGDGSQRAMLERRAMDVDRIDFVDPVDSDRYVRLLGAADILLLNERSTVSGMAVPSKLTSYFASGRPVLAATDPGSASASEIQSSGAGVLARAGDPAALLEAAIGLAADPGGDEMGRRGLKYVRETLSPERAAADYVSWVEDLIAMGNSKREN